jgi:predicted tellurium resistance membrane protein TerC
MEIFVALITLVALEIVLGIDNIIFVSILTSKLPEESQKKARLIGISLAMFMRIALLFSLSLIMKLTTPFLYVYKFDFSGRDMILLIGGLFLIGKSTFEIHEKLEGSESAHSVKIKKISFGSIIVQILILDIIFSLDSVITAIGMANDLWIMVTAVVISVIFMLFTAGAVSSFVHKHPTFKILALSFLLLIGIMLVAESFKQNIPKGYIYFAMAFSVFVETINLKMKARNGNPVQLKEKQLS